MRPHLRPLALIALGFTVPNLVATSCIYEIDNTYCRSGLWPYDGQTAVPLDALIEIRTLPLPDDAPALHDAVTLVNVDTNEPVPFDLEVINDDNGATLYLVPREPLRADTSYATTAFARGSGLNEVGYYHDGELRVGASTFTTASEPQILGARAVDGVIEVAFSEPMDLDTLDDLYFAWGNDTEAQHAEAERIGFVDGLAHILAFRIPEDAVLPLEVVPGPDLRAATGEGLRPLQEPLWTGTVVSPIVGFEIFLLDEYCAVRS